ncbi:MAG: hypothetical protein KC466_10495 [Myxococcales bacterium]|nr:hypothetical protein [Myxococcales bacterium]
MAKQPTDRTPHPRNVDLDRILDATRRGQWSVHAFDWDQPLGGIEGTSKRELREMGRMLVFTAGLERQAARIFDLCAHYVADKRAKQIFELFAIDERRHAEAEIRMAARHGVGWGDLPLVTRAAFRDMERRFRRPSRCGGMKPVAIT